MREYQPPRLLIDNEWIEASGETTDIINPATGVAIGKLPHATEADLDRALAAAKNGFDLWRGTPIERRTEIIREGVRLLRLRAEEIATTLTLEQGKPFSQAKTEVERAGDFFEWDSAEGRRLYGRVVPGPAGIRQMVLREPIGPVAAFTPWNFPAAIVSRKLAAVLASGCSVVLKPSEETPATACAVAKCFIDAGLPPGVINIVHGDPARISAHLIASPVIRLITLTGSTAVGRQIAQLAARNLKPSVMELGGHAPVIVCDDADPIAAAKLSAITKYRNAGQVCVSPTRFLVHERCHDAFVEAFSRTARELKVGSGFEEGVQMGPLANGRRVSAMERLVADAADRGATITTGGSRIGRHGWFFEPTVLTEVATDAMVMCQEPFGPVAPIARFRDLDDAIATANRLPYGLASYAFTDSSRLASSLADRLDVGLLSINHMGAGVPEAPFGGVKESGYGREGGVEGLQAYTISKFVSHRASI